MHPAALSYVSAHVPCLADSILDFGSRNINGSARSVTRARKYVGVDIAPGDGVDVVGDAALVALGRTFDAVVCAEVLEHADDQTCAGIVANAYAHLNPGGVFVATMAGLSREPHSAVDGGPVRAGEFYRNVDRDLLASWLTAAGFVEFEIDERRADIRCTARKAS